MAPYCDINVEEVEPMSRTYQYRKVMKPLLERKRRARINKCLDQLKELMVGALQKDNESISKLEKADVLELTVTHLKKLKKHNALAIPAQSHSQEKFNSGFRQCASEVSKFMNTAPGIDAHVSNRLFNHLGGCVNHLDKLVSVQNSQHISSNSPSPSSPITVNIPSKMYTPPSSPELPHQQMAVSPKIESSYSPIQYSRVAQSYIPPTAIKQEHFHKISLCHQANPALPPSPPLSTGSLSPVHLARPSSSASDFSVSSPKPSSFSPVSRVVANIPEITDGPIWRPW